MVFDRPGQQLGDMREQRQEYVHTLGDGFRAPGKVHDEGSTAGDGDTAGESGVGRVAKAVGDERHGNPGHVPLGDVARGLRRDVPGCKAGATGGEDHVAQCIVCPDTQVLGDELPVIRDYVAPHQYVARFQNHPDDRVATLIQPFAGGAFIGTGEDRDSGHRPIVDWQVRNVDGG